MADEITYDRVEEAEDAILKAINGVGDTVNGLPSSLEADFTEVKEAIADVKFDVGNVNTAVGGVKEDTELIKETVSNIKSDTVKIIDSSESIKYSLFLNSFSQAKVQYVHDLSTETTVVNVSGKGFFYGCANVGGAFPKVTVEIDGVSTTKKGSSNKTCGFLSPQMMAHYATNSDWTFNTTSDVLDRLTAPILFEKSLKITLDPNSNYWLMYSLI